jgi:hypothetical protein
MEVLPRQKTELKRTCYHEDMGHRDIAIAHISNVITKHGDILWRYSYAMLRYNPPGMSGLVSVEKCPGWLAGKNTKSRN